LIISKIEENQRNQVEQIYIVDNINDEEIVSLSPVRADKNNIIHHERRVTTVEEQQTQEDMEDDSEYN
jgi:hypothetical protein